MRERARDRGRRLGLRAVAIVAEELRRARVTTGVSRRELGASAGVSRTTEARYEQGHWEGATIVGAAELLAVGGIGLTVSTYPLGDRPRDGAHAAFAAAFLRKAAEPLIGRTEVPLPNAGDVRGWDATLTGHRRRTGIEFVRVLGDIQDQSRRIALKRRDGGVDYLLVVIADTRSNRRILGESPGFLPELRRLKTSFVLDELAAGRHPGDGVVFFGQPGSRTRTSEVHKETK